MFNLGGLEILVILVVALLVLGPDKLPGFMRVVGRFMGEARRASTEFQRSINTTMTEETDKPNTAVPAPPLPPDSEAEGSHPFTPDASHTALERHTPSRPQLRPGRKLSRVIRRPGRTKHASPPTEAP